MLLMCDLHLVLIYIFMMSNEVETTFHVFIGHFDILFYGPMLTQVFCLFFIWVAVFFLLVCGEWPTICCFYFIGGYFFLVLMFIFKYKIY